MTAATRQHAAVVQGMMQRAAVLQHVDAPTLEPVLCGMIKDGGHAGFVSTLCDLPAAAQFEGDSVCKLLLTAAQHKEYAHAARLCRLAGAQQMTGEHVVALLAVFLVTYGSSSYWESHLSQELVACMASIFALPAAQQLSCSSILRLLRACRDAQSSCTFQDHVMRLLSRLPAAVQLQPRDPVQRMLLDIRQGDSRLVSNLARLPAAQDISGEPLLQLLTAAAKEPAWASCVGTEELCELPAAAQISDAEAAGLLVAALQQGKAECMEA